MPRQIYQQNTDSGETEVSNRYQTLRICNYNR